MSKALVLSLTLVLAAQPAFAAVKHHAAAHPAPASPVLPPAAPLPTLDAAGKPLMSLPEAQQQFEALGYRFGQNEALNYCNHPSQPHVDFTDLNGDGFPEAILRDSDAACYGGAFVSIAWRQRNGVWAWLFRGRGTLSVDAKSSNGWRDLHLKTKCDTLFQHDADRYQPASYCQADGTPLPAPTPADFAAAFTAAGLVRQNGTWTSCTDDDTGQSSAEIQNGDVRDINGDGVNDLIITEGSEACYGNTGTGYHIMTRDAGGAWIKLASDTGIPTFLPTAVKTPGGWPDIEVGGPGFCFPVERWNGQAYVQYRNHEYDKGACKRQGM